MNSILRYLLLAPIVGATFSDITHGQSGQISSSEVAFVHDTGWVSGPQDQGGLTSGFAVEVKDARWLRLRFSDIELAPGARLVMTGVLDGARQELEAHEVLQWRHSSAYFNGDAVWVEIAAPAGSAKSRVRLANVEFGPPQPLFTICGPVDDRVLAADPRVGRLQPNGCSVWLIDDCNHCLLTAGHCPEGWIVEFNVPLSYADGTVVHADPDDQYAVDSTSLQGAFAPNDDWAYFGCFANSNTGQTPYERQGSAFSFVAPPTSTSGVTVRVTGFGIDATPNEWNRAQQTHRGQLLGFEGDGGTLLHNVDTYPGNSGSPMIWYETGKAIGIHTEGGCNTTGGANLGTSLMNPGLHAAIANARGVCAAAKPWATYCLPKLNSQGCAPEISATGAPTVAGGAGSFAIKAKNVINNQDGFLFYGFVQGTTPFQNGALCIRDDVTRTAKQSSGGNASGTDCSGTYSFDMGRWIASGHDPRLKAGTTVFAQYWQRDPQSPNFPTGLTNAIRFTIAP
jgi:hypothetical protein